MEPATVDTAEVTPRWGGAWRVGANPELVFFQLQVRLMQVRGPAVDHGLHVVGLHHLGVIGQRLAGTFAYHLGEDPAVCAVEKLRFRAQGGFLVADPGTGTDRCRYQRDRDEFIGLEAFGLAADHVRRQDPVAGA